ncbi:MAG: endonuclease/exonuclease/phosphatase family protein [Dokdonella sp.]
MTRLRIATWNIHGGVGLDGRFSPDRIARVIAELDADVIALQEFGSRRIAFDMRAHLEEAGNARAIVMPTFSKHGSDFGNVVLSRFHAGTATRRELGIAPREPRNAIDVIVETPAGPLRVIATHLGLRASERFAQIAMLRRELDTPVTLPTVLLGDFNEWRWGGGALQELDAHFGMSRAPRTFPSPYPMLALDRIWVSSPSACVDLQAHRSRTARIASDHLPLVATLEFP